MKKLCSEQLESLSKRQVKSIITGQEMASSDDESMEEEESVGEIQLKKQNTNEERKRMEVNKLLSINCITKLPSDKCTHNTALFD